MDMSVGFLKSHEYIEKNVSSDINRERYTFAVEFHKMNTIHIRAFTRYDANMCIIY